MRTAYIYVSALLLKEKKKKEKKDRRSVPSRSGTSMARCCRSQFRAHELERRANAPPPCTRVRPVFPYTVLTA